MPECVAKRERGVGRGAKGPTDPARGPSAERAAVKQP
jgi:hypothetical protein